MLSWPAGHWDWCYQKTEDGASIKGWCRIPCTELSKIDLPGGSSDYYSRSPVVPANCVTSNGKLRMTSVRKSVSVSPSRLSSDAGFSVAQMDLCPICLGPRGFSWVLRYRPGPFSDDAKRSVHVGRERVERWASFFLGKHACHLHRRASWYAVYTLTTLHTSEHEAAEVNGIPTGASQCGDEKQLARRCRSKALKQHPSS